MKLFLGHYWPALFWALFIFVMCTIKLGSVPSSPLFFEGFDKLVHCGFFFVQVVLIGYGLIRSGNNDAFSYKQIIIAVLLSVFYGGSIELLQKYIFTWRSGEWADFFADSVGALMAAFSIFTVFKALSYVKK